jgi:1-acyl-sn-glycerol-3-phosphate acyltransferase
MNRFIKILFFALVIKPMTLVMLGLNIRNRQALPESGPSIIAANHNSHLDTIVLMSMYPLSQIHKVRPVAAADYFLKNKFLKWFSLNIIGIIPLERKARMSKDILFAGCKEALLNKDILILYPEGSRGKPGKMAELKKGIFHIAQLVPKTHVTPVLMHGLDKALPKGEALFVPFNCDLIVGEKVSLKISSQDFVNDLKSEFENLSQFCLTH